MSRADMQNNSEVTERSVLEPFETETETTFQESNSKKRTPLYKLWPGKQRFFCKGRIMRGPEGEEVIYAIYFHIFVLPAIYAAIFFPYIWKNVSPAIPIVFTYFFLQSVFCMFMTVCSDPGIIPRRSVFLAAIGEVPERFAQFNSITYKTDENTQSTVSFTFCETCKIYRPPRAHHCRKCDCCMEVYDHHCTFLNNCIAKKNYQYFVSFLVSVCLLIFSGLAGVGFCFVIWAKNKLKKVPESEDGSLSDTTREVIAYVMGIPAIILLLVLIGFVLFHAYLILTKRTTKEKLKKTLSVPYHQLEKTTKTIWFNYEPPLVDFTQQLTQKEVNIFYRAEAQNVPSTTRDVNEIPIEAEV